ncbi:ABC transporter permease [Kitasatospora phosalacinea]|uniref:ABC transporter permease n=1 Tax=Kitasatospora phosalacinea TaxID=2065 RepID=UPI0035E26D32
MKHPPAGTPRRTLRRALAAEWTKFRTDATHARLLLGLVVLTVAVGAATAATTTCPAPGCGVDAPRTALTGVLVGQVAAVVLGVLTAGSEYHTGMIRTTLAAVPSRSAVLAAKALVLSAAVAVAGALAVAGSLLAARLLLPGNGFTPAHGYPALSLADGPTLRAATGSVLYLLLVALLGLGTVTATRSSAAATGAVLGLLFVFPAVIAVVGDPDWQRRLQQFAPMPAGLAVQATLDTARLPVAPWPGLGVLALWTAAALALGRTVLHARYA